MKKTTRTMGTVFAAVVLGGALLNSPLAARAAAPRQADAQGQENSAATAAQARLSKKQFQNVHVTVENGIATLTGTVDLYEYKADAQKSVLHAKGVNAVRNMIEVAGPSISDKDLQAKLVEKLAYDRVGYGNVFDAIGVKVENGMVTLEGHAHDYPNRDSAVATVATTPGVKDVVDNIEVDPDSQMDDRTRVAVARAIYSFPSLNKYAVDPEMPIRVSVQNGNVSLYGSVNSQADKEAAYIQANAVSGVFSVKNYLQVTGQTSERQ